jgi:hypothetical protein
LLFRYFEYGGGMLFLRLLGISQKVQDNLLNWQDWAESYTLDLVAGIKQLIKEYSKEVDKPNEQN